MDAAPLSPGDPVNHPSFGRGVVEFPKGRTALVRFGHGIEECVTSELSVLQSASTAYLAGDCQPLTQVLLRLLGETIPAINDAWGVFSPSRIDLYPHQLWVCRKVTERWPVRWVVADDVGLGKTVEAGLILWRLLQLRLVKRLLILCPASLVAQWQERLFKMFDIRTAQYDPSEDTERVDYWSLNPFVVASFHTLREDRHGRHSRMLDSEPWDLIIVDEAHHLNFDESSGMTLAHRLVRTLQDSGRLQSLLLFTGTPHRGKHFGFFALMSLVRPDLFDPRKPVDPQLRLLPHALIRNNKYHVTDLQGTTLFMEPEVSTTSYRYSEAEDRFYRMMTEFIASGRAYASGLDVDRARTVMLVLIALQKLASSSIAAVRSALQKRLFKLKGFAADHTTLSLADSIDDEDVEARNQRAEETVESLALELTIDECARLEELIASADEVLIETKLEAILSSVKDLPADESVLFFTEYKVTQALLVSALFREFGESTATFINGDGALPSVLCASGRRSLRESRHSAQEKFNSGAVRFLVSTEAAGEGVDLQHRCSRLIHVDLPWNPMRLHQRVGRLNRIGQRHTVKVMIFQNPDTVESRIWTLLNEKLERIRSSINAVTEKPEDLHQLVLGVAGPGLLDQVFSQASDVPRATLDQWFDQQTGQIGGEDVVRVVRDLIGHAQHFDFSSVSEQVPKLDLPALAPFLRLALKSHRRLVSESNGGFSFKTPESWQKTQGVFPRYEDVHFDRSRTGRSKGTVLGVGAKLLDVALEEARSMPGVHGWTSDPSCSGSLFVFRCYDRITGNPAQPRQIICAVLHDAGELRLLRDAHLLDLLNGLADTSKTADSEAPAGRPAGSAYALSEAEALLQGSLPSMDLPFRQADIELIGVIRGT